MVLACEAPDRLKRLGFDAEPAAHPVHGRPAALIVATAEVFAVLILPSYLTSAVGFLLLVLVLVLRPGGLFGHRVLS